MPVLKSSSCQVTLLEGVVSLHEYTGLLKKQ